MGNAKTKLRARSAKTKPGKTRSVHIEQLPESSTAQKTVDPRLPFDSYRQVFTFRNSWKSVSRALEETAKENLVRFFQQFPAHQELFPKLKNLKSEEEMRESIEFENQAVAIFTVFDETMDHIENIDKAMFGIKNAAHAHKNIPGFNEDFFKDMEGPFLESIRQTLDERFTEATEDNFRRFYNFMTKSMTEATNS